ncbi:hypothetical protein [Pseudorhodoferax sp. Leaf274]|uniref:hypothetical protein n=1 Tax=Pseudorhodoferax sp. Leaf274 TaxID=1736318 RepID=UPI0007038C0A|nr:hypothetical protein [Pseudorhodoferax sp. Leaf274]KQP43514.1 hypothetical protein ASF44_29750 [Pseudorhodoferax sp. Leaf274]
MSDGIISAFIAASAAVFGVILTQVLGEKYRRFKEGSSVAAGILGELSSYEQAWPLVQAMLRGLDDAVSAGARERFSMRFGERAKDLYFDEVVSKIGLLGPDIVEPVVYVYSNIRAFRVALELISVHHKDMTDGELFQRSQTCQQCLQRALARREELFSKLKARSSRRMRLSD